MLLVAGFSQVHCRQRGRYPSFIQIHNGCCVVISVSFTVFVYASCDLLHSWNSFLGEDIHMEVGRRPASFHCFSLLLALLPSLLPSLAGGDREPAHTLKLTEYLVPPLLPFLLLSFYPSLPPSLPPSPAILSYRVGGDKEPAHKLLLYLNPSPSLLPSIPPSLPPSLLPSFLPSFVGVDREPAYTLRLTEDRGLKRLLGMAMKPPSSLPVSLAQTATQKSAVSQDHH